MSVEEKSELLLVKAIKSALFYGKHLRFLQRVPKFVARCSSFGKIRKSKIRGARFSALLVRAK